MKRYPSLGAFLPFLVFFLIVIVLYHGLSLHPEKIDSPLIGEPAPAFSLPELAHPDRLFDENLFAGQITLLNVWASWCEACRMEHPLLLQLAKDPRFQLIGMDYRDNTKIAEDWLRQSGNPYRLVLADTTGKTAIDWGVYGTPETFVIDRQGKIRYRQVGVISAKIWQKTLLPLLTELEKE